MEKTYKTISSANISKTIIVNNEEILIDFLGGSLFPYFKSGTFTTSNKNIQNILERSNSYGIDYIKDTRTVVKAKKLNLEVVKGINNKQLALEWIDINLKKKFHYLENDEIIKEFVQANGYSINWR